MPVPGVISSTEPVLAVVRPSRRSVLMLGKSASTSDRKLGAAALPIAGPAKIVFAFCVASDKDNVPLDVIGDPETVKKEGAVSATLVTPPDPDADVEL